MNRAQLEHVIRAAAAISDVRDVILIGSNAVLGQFPDAPPELCLSEDVDLYPRDEPERAELVDGAIGELSPFHETFGYHAQGVAETTATLPDGWRDRLVSVASGTATGWCLEIHDLVISKYVANPEKDRDYVKAALRHRLVDADVLRARWATTPVNDPQLREYVGGLLEADLARSSTPELSATEWRHAAPPPCCRRRPVLPAQSHRWSRDSPPSGRRRPSSRNRPTARRWFFRYRSASPSGDFGSSPLRDASIFVRRPADFS